ncbi:MAG: caspase family protein, partial [Prevotellaceae bacterium]|nr:caspase family protein [Prevotellaceae bacterium]
PVQPVKPEQPTNVAPAPDTPPSAVAPQSVAPDIKIWVVIVGVASYSGINSLNYTDDDAYKMYAFYKSPEGGSLPDTQIEVLIDEDATRKNIMTALDNIYSKATEKDVIIFYFSGHGSKEAFVTHEYDGERDSNGDYKGFLLHNELHNIFDKSPAKYKYIIADACHSGSSANKGPTGSGNATYYRAFEQAKGGFVMLLSSMGDEVSVETRGVRQGVFSHFLIRGLKGEADTNKDRMISVIELFEYVEPNVKRYTNNKQNPILFGDFNDVLPISVIK